jgi:antitoxin component YwqK of YwqJK toxin-antitoxin module
MRTFVLGLVGAGLLFCGGCGEERDEVADSIMRQQSLAETASAESADSTALKAVLSDLPALEVQLEGYPPGTTVHQSRYPDGKPLAEGFLNQDRPIGPWRYWHPGGILAAQGTFLQGGRKHGEWVSWNDVGIRISKGTYDTGKEVGEWRYWYPNGRPSMKGPYILGQRHGAWQHWHPTGAKASQGDYIRDRQVGRWLQWDIKGQPLSDIGYQRSPGELDG